MNRFFALVFVTAVACAPSSGAADSALPGIDTVKAAPDSLARLDSTVPGSTSTSPPVTKTTTTSTKTGTQRDTTNIGRDRAIQIDTKDPKRRLPPVDTTKRPPQ